ncbi:MAG: hypothetical protein E7620_04065 [Ruminococcaceae bacterium]|nr:hypothetical protein [Oscillospiraceae bacterium]
MMKKSAAPKKVFYLWIAHIVGFCAIYAFVMITVLSTPSKTDNRLFVFSYSIVFVAYIWFLTVTVNHGFSRVWIDTDRRRIGRKGLFWGLRKEISFDDVAEIVIVRSKSHLLVVVERRDKNNLFFGKDPCITMTDTPENRLFLRLAWGGVPTPMTEWEWRRRQKMLRNRHN